MSNELQFQRRPRCRYSISALIVGSIQSAFLSTGRTIWAEALVPGITSVAICGAGGGVRPPPVCIDDNALGLRLAASRFCAGLDGERWVVFRCVGPDLLTIHGSTKYRCKHNDY